MAKFQSTPPVRGATDVIMPPPPAPGISIHAPRAGGDRHARSPIITKLYFNPRPPCGGRPETSTDP